MKFSSLLLAAAILFTSCNNGSTNSEHDGTYQEPTPETVSLDNAVFSYYGDPYYSGESDLWILELSTTPAEGEYVKINVSVNAEPGLQGKPDITLLNGRYNMPSNSGDMSAGTFNTGYTDTQDRPNGAVEIPAGSYFANVSEESDEPVETDLLREGYCTVTVGTDGKVSIEGVMIGTQYFKRYFTYEGTPEVTDKSEGGDPGVPNSNLTEDAEPSALAKTRLVDKGDSYALGDQSYRLFEFYLADEGIDLTPQWPTGSGELLRLEFFVPWDTDKEEGLPAGTYTMPENIPAGGGIYRDDIVPFRLVPGYPDKFTNNSGTWYQFMEDGTWIRYARITGGSVTVERPEGKYRITADLTDCGTPAHHVKFVWEE